jgi:hypothetical protein
MTGPEFFASIGLPALLVAAAYVSVVIYEWQSRIRTGDSKDANRHDTNPM